MIAIHVEFPKSSREEREEALRRLVPLVCAAIGEPDVAGTLAVALADPVIGLACFQALAAEYEESEPVPAVVDDRMRTCRQCANLSPGGRCLAAWRGEPFGNGIAVTRNYQPLDPDRPQRCLPYRPGARDHDRRSGAERWPWLNALGVPSA